MPLQQAIMSDADSNVDHTATLDHVPELWVEILRRVPELDRLRHVPLVCRRFSEACQDPATWPHLHVLHAAFPTDTRWGSFMRWVAVRGSGLQSLVLKTDPCEIIDGYIKNEGWERRTPQLMALLIAAAPQLQSLNYVYPGEYPATTAAVFPTALSQLSQLTSLTLNFGKVSFKAAQVDTIVVGLPSLQCLDLSGGRSFLNDGYPMGIYASCSKLRTLRMHTGYKGEVPAELGRLTLLTNLVLGASCTRIPESISCLVNLRAVKLSNYARYMDVPEQLWQLKSITRLGLIRTWQNLPSSISQLTALKELESAEFSNLILPSELTACRELTSLRMGSDDASPVLARLQSLRSLWVQMSLSQLSYNVYWTQLTGLTELVLHFGGTNVSDFSGLYEMTSIRDLTMKGGRGILAGPILNCLQKLCFMYWEHEGGLLAALQGAAHLNKLDFQPPHDLNAEEVAALVDSLPAALETLVVQYDLERFTREEWSERVSHLRAEYVAQGRTPPSIEK